DDGHVLQLLPFPTFCLSLAAVDAPHRRWHKPTRRGGRGPQYGAPGGAASSRRSHAPACPTALSAHAPRTPRAGALALRPGPHAYPHAGAAPAAGGVDGLWYRLLGGGAGLWNVLA